MVWNCNSLMRRRISLKHNVTSPFVYDLIVKSAYKSIRDLTSAKVPGKLHATVKTSSRTK